MDPDDAGVSQQDAEAAPRLSVGLLGPLTIGGEAAPAGLSVKAKAVFAYLAAERGAAVARDRLADLCWERSGPEQARQSLRQALSQLRRALPAAVSEQLLATPDVVRLVHAETDAAALEQVAAAADPAAWEAALALVRGPFAADLETGSPGFDDWAARERMRYETMAADVLARLASHRLDAGEAEAALDPARRLVALDPLREDGHRLLIRALAGAGRRAEALAHYKELERLLRTELSVQPDPATRALIEGLREPAAATAHPTSARPALAGPGESARPMASPAIVSLLSQPQAAPETPAAAPRPRLLRFAAALVGVALLAAGGFAAYRAARPTPATAAPVLVVKPFEALSAEPETAALGRALTTRLSGGLSTIPTIRVRSAEARGPDPDLRLEGAVQAADGGALVTARLVRASGEVLHQVEYKAPPRPPVDMQDEILGRVGRLMTEKLDELAYPWSVSSPGASHVMDTAITARNLVNRGDTSDRVIELFRTALRQEPDNLQIKAMFANALVGQALNGGLPQNRQRDSLAEAMRLFDEVETAAPHLQRVVYGRCQALRALADLQATLADLQAARAACQRSRTLMPWSARVYKELGYTFLMLGVLDQADGYFQAAERLERVGTIRWTWAVGAGATALLRGQPEAAGRWFQTATILRPNNRWYYLFAAVAARRSGDEEAVRRHLARFRDLPAATSLDDYFESFFPAALPYPSSMREGLTALKQEMAAMMR
jgi:DNA-binding SARP family transcriptional activator/TolB-like protein